MAITAPTNPKPVVEAEYADEGEGEEPAQHHQIALGEIDDLGCLVNEHKAERDQAVNAAERDATHQLLNEVQHQFPPRCQAILSIAFSASCVYTLTGIHDAEQPHMSRSH